MATIKHNAERLALSAGIDYASKHIEKNPQKGILDIIDLVEKYMPSTKHDETYTDSGNAYTNFRRFINDPDSKWLKYGTSLFNDLDPKILKTFILNLGFEAGYCGLERARTLRDQYHLNFPWVILFDPTSACNRHCTGCWSAEYGHKLNLSFEDMDKIVTEGKELGIYFYMMTGGEPLVRKDDVIKLCKKHKNCIFSAFTNGTLVDEAFCKDMKDAGNLFLNLSIEGFEESNDSRRGIGAFDKSMEAMDLLKKNKLLFGTSICYTSKNYKTVVSDEFLDLIIKKGCKFSWYFHYMPVGNDASVDLIPTVEQRTYMYHRIREIRSMKNKTQIFPMDFQNDGEFVGGCIAGGKNYLHINANGDVEPCVFIHYSTANIKEVSLLEALKQPLFKAYHDNQAFNDNMLRPCPMLENPEFLERMVKETGAKSTDLASPESVDHLCAKCKDYAKEWTPVADELWTASQKAKKNA
ncbi:radical SAM protein [uncultured Sphaerochaeta sp.]|uniref:radical SAM protein n=1 Tax=uncultured Sphaerochaeta sp. TaxID=886478 RepID=UPI002A0A60A3|nr:radical SAM protein [uncultured Sphaerochaeta sp.]